MSVAGKVEFAVDRFSFRGALLLGTALTGVVALPLPASALLTNYTGGNGNWFVAGNWAPSVPTVADIANLTNPGTAGTPAFINAPAAGALTVNINNGNTLNVGGGGQLTVLGTFTNATATANAVNVFGATSAITAATIVNSAGGFSSSGSTITGTTAIFNLGTFSASGAVVSPVINNQAGSFNVTGALTGTGAFNNSAGTALNVSGGSFNGTTTLTNAGTASIAAGQALNATTLVSNLAGGVINNVGALTAPTISNQGALNSTGTVGTLATTTTNAGTVNASGAFAGTINNSGTFNVTGALTGTGAFTNAAGGALNVNGGSFTGIGALVNNATITIGAGNTLSAASVNNAAGATIANSGTLTSAAVIGNAGILNNLGAASIINGGVANSGTLTNAGTLNGGLANTAGTTTNAGTINGGAAVSGGTVTNNNLVVGTVGISGAGTFNNNLTITGAVNNAATFNNNAAGTVSGLLTNTAGASVNAGQLNGGATVTGGTLTSTNIVNGGIINAAAGTVNVQGNTAGTLANLGAFTVTGALNAGAGAINNNGGTFTVNGALTNAGAVTNAAGATLANNALLTATGPVVNNGALNNNAAGTITNGVTNNAGTTTNAGTINGGAIVTGGTLNTNTATSVVNGGLTNTAIVNAAGQINGAIANNAGGAFTVVGNLAGNTFANAAGATLTFNPGSTLIGFTALTNAGTVNGGLVNPTGMTTTNTGTINGGVNVTGGTLNTNTATSVVNGGLTNTAIVNAAGQVNGAIANNAGGVFTVVGNLAGNNAFTNAVGATLTVNAATAFSGLTTLTNNGTVTNNGTLSTTGGTTNTGLLNTNTAASSLNGGLANTGIVNAAGQINGVTANNAGGAFNVVGNLSGNNSLTNAANATLKINTGSTLNGFTSVTNAGTLLPSAAGAVTIVAPTFTNTGTINLQNGSSTDVLTINGKYVGGGVISLDTNLSVPNATQTPTSDKVTILNGAASSGATLVQIKQTDLNKSFFQNPIKLITGAGTATFAAANDAGTAAALSSLGGNFVTYNFQALGGGDWGIVALVNTAAAAGPAAQIATSISSINTGFFQNTSSFISAPPSDEANKLYGGLWIRPSEGSSTTTSTSTNSNPFAPPTASKVKFDYAGYQLGADIAFGNVGNTGFNVHAGLTAGQVGAKASDQINAGSSSNFEVPFYGVYMAATGHGFFVDLLLRHDIVKMKIINTAAGLNAPTSLKAHGDTISLSGGYRFDINGYFIEPSGTITLSQHKIDPLSLGGTGSLTFAAMKSTLGRIGLRAGTTVQASESLVLQPFVALSLWREFSGNLGTTFTDPLNQQVVISTSRVGTFTQLSAGIAGQLVKAPVIGFVRADMRMGTNISGWGATAGLRYSF